MKFMEKGYEDYQFQEDYGLKEGESSPLTSYHQDHHQYYYHNPNYYYYYHYSNQPININTRTTRRHSKQQEILLQYQR